MILITINIKFNKALCNELLIAKNCKVNFKQSKGHLKLTQHYEKHTYSVCPLHKIHLTFESEHVQFNCETFVV